MKKDDAIKAMRDRVREGKARKSRMWLDELEKSVNTNDPGRFWNREQFTEVTSIRGEKTKIRPDGTIDWN